MSNNFREKVPLGKTGLMASRLGIGAGYSVPAKSVEKAFHEYGINYFYWGSRKKGMKEALKNLVKNHRDKMIIAIQSYDPTALYMKRSLENGMKELGIDYMDVFIIGWRRSLPGKRILDIAYQMKEEKKIRFTAMSSHRRVLFQQLAKQKDSPVDIFMLRYNAAHRGAEEEIFPYLPDKNRPGITSYTATRWGHLLQKDKMPAREESLSSTDCYRFVLSNPNVDLCMIGPSNEEEMAEALLTLDKGPLSREEMARIKKIGDFVKVKKKFF